MIRYVTRRIVYVFRASPGLPPGPCRVCGSLKRRDVHGNLICDECNRRRAKAYYDRRVRKANRCARCDGACNVGSRFCFSCAPPPDRSLPTGHRHLWPDGYVRIKAIGHANANARGWVREHVFVMSEAIGRPIAASEVVHHVNHDVLDNRLDNLVLLSRSEHSKYHAEHDLPSRRRDSKGRFV